MPLRGHAGLAGVPVVTRGAETMPNFDSLR
jgi:hypothetical protein